MGASWSKQANTETRPRARLSLDIFWEHRGFLEDWGLETLLMPDILTRCPETGKPYTLAWTPRR
jgi:hypothetical protein